MSFRIKIVTVGKIKTDFWLAAEAEFTKRIKRYADLKYVITQEASLNSLRNQQLVVQREAESIRKNITANDFLIALSPGGKQFTSESFASFFSEKSLHGTNQFTMLIGGPLGLDEDILKQSDLILSLSKMTLPHELAKVVLLEQVYRAFTIMRGEKYHK